MTTRHDSEVIVSAALNFRLLRYDMTPSPLTGSQARVLITAESRAT